MHGIMDLTKQKSMLSLAKVHALSKLACDINQLFSTTLK